MKTDTEILTEKASKLFCVCKNMDNPEQNVIVFDGYDQELMLNKTASMIWNLIDDSRTGQEIVDEIWAQVGSDPETSFEEVRRGVVDFIRTLKERNLISFVGQMSIWAED